MLPLAAPLFAEMLLGLGMGPVGTVLAARLGDAHGGRRRAGHGWLSAARRMHRRLRRSAQSAG